MNCLPRAGGPRNTMTCRSPKFVEAKPAAGGGIIVGSGLCSDVRSKCSCDLTKWLYVPARRPSIARGSARASREALPRRRFLDARRGCAVAIFGWDEIFSRPRGRAQAGDETGEDMEGVASAAA